MYIRELTHMDMGWAWVGWRWVAGRYIHSKMVQETVFTYLRTWVLRYAFGVRPPARLSVDLNTTFLHRKRWFGCPNPYI